MHPRHRAHTVYLKKRRRNNRVLEKSYDAKYIDSRTGEKASGQQLFSGRSKRNKNLSVENLHRYRQRKTSKGRRAIRTKHYLIQPGTIVLYQHKRCTANATHCNDTRAILQGIGTVAVKKLRVIKYGGGWIPA